MNRRLMLISVAVLACVAAVVLAGCGAGSSQKTLTLVQEPGTVKDVAMDTNPKEPAGDVYVFEGPVTKDGKEVGVMLGSITTLFPEMKSFDPKVEDRLLAAVFDLSDGQISVLGSTPYSPNAAQGDFQSLTRPVVGGTGAYLNAHGEVTTTFNKSDNTYTHVITYSTD